MHVRVTIIKPPTKLRPKADEKWIGASMPSDEVLGTLPQCTSTSGAAAAEELKQHFRELLVPAAMVGSPVPTDALVWAHVLCCVYTHVVVMEGHDLEAAAPCGDAATVGSTPARLADYDGSVRCFPEQVELI